MSQYTCVSRTFYMLAYGRDDYPETGPKVRELDTKRLLTTLAEKGVEIDEKQSDATINYQDYCAGNVKSLSGARKRTTSRLGTELPTFGEHFPKHFRDDGPNPPYPVGVVLRKRTFVVNTSAVVRDVEITIGDYPENIDPEDKAMPIGNGLKCDVRIGWTILDREMSFETAGEMVAAVEESVREMYRSDT